VTTYGERFQAQVNSDLEAARRLTERHYSVEDVRALVSSAGTKLELFLKGVAFVGANTQDTLYDFTNRLSGQGASQGTVRVLHQLRQEYNSVKHDPAHEPTLLAVLDLLQRFHQVVHEVVALGLGMTDRPVREGNRRVFWVAACDHYIGADTEVHIYLPARPEGWPVPPSFDLVYIDMSSWNDVKETLAVIGQLASAEEHFPEGMLEELSGEEGFLEAFAFEGDYRSLLTTLTQHERRLDLIPGLRRQDSLIAMVQAFLLAAIDVAGVAGDADQEEIRQEIKAQAFQVYAVPQDLRGADDLTSGMAHMICKIDPTERSLLAGPIFVNLQSFESRKERALALHPDFRILVDENHTICMID
jgi:hypothetical protein